MPFIRAKEDFLHSVDIEDGFSHGLRFEAGHVYKVSSGDAVYFTSHGWATRVSGDEAESEGVSRPINTQDATEEDAREWDRREVEPDGTTVYLDVHDAFSVTGTSDF